MRRYRVGIVGCGGRAHQHVEALRHMPEVEIAGAADVRPDRLHSFCDRWEIEQRYETATALLEAGRLDLVTIVTLPEPRAALVIEAARAGVPAINAEKVACYRIAEMDAMLEACAAAGSLLTINHQMRFMEQFVAVRNLVRSGRLGRVTFLRAGSRGHLTEQGPHVMDQVLFMNDESPAVWAMGQADGAEGYERGHRAPSSTAATVRFANGACGLIENGLLAPEPHPDSGFWLQKFVEVTGTEGWAGAYVNDGWRAVLVSGQSLSGPGAWEPNRVPQAALFRCALQWVEDRSVEHPCRAEVARRGLEALLAVCRSAIDRRAVTLPLERGEDPLSELQPLLGRALGAE